MKFLLTWTLLSFCFLFGCAKAQGRMGNTAGGIGNTGHEKLITAGEDTMDTTKTKYLDKKQSLRGLLECCVHSNVQSLCTPVTPNVNLCTTISFHVTYLPHCQIVCH